MSLSYRPEIDGLRAIAVLPVIFFHVGFPLFEGGYTGVDIFFVISGYLISSIIYEQLKKKRFSIVRFYEKRARRLMPMLFAVMLVSTPFAWVSLNQTDMIDFFESLLAVSTFVSNFLFVIESGYFDTAVELKPLLHTWSLAVEEQFYLFFPLFLILFFRFSFHGRIIHVVSTVLIISFLLAEWASTNHSAIGFYLLPTRAWELSSGALVGIYISEKKASSAPDAENLLIAEVLSWLGMILLFCGFFIIDELTPFPGRYALFPVVGTTLLIIFTSAKSSLGKILSNKVFVLIGLTSYSSYLLHQPVFAFAKHLSVQELSIISKFSLIALVLFFSFLTWKYIETPFRNPQWISRKGIFTFFFTGSVFFIILGGIGMYFKGFPEREVSKRLSIGSYEPDNRKLKSDSWGLLNSMDKQGVNHTFDDSDSRTRLLILGNSHSKDMFNVLYHSETARRNFQVIRKKAQLSKLMGEPGLLLSSSTFKDAEIVMLVARYYHNDMGHADDIPHLNPFTELILEKGKKLVLVKEIHNFKMIGAKTIADVEVERSVRKGRIEKKWKSFPHLARAIDSLYFLDFTAREITERKAASDRELELLKVEYPGIIVLDRMDYVCDKENRICFGTSIDLAKYFYDYGHHTLEGAMFFGGRVDETGWLDPLISLPKSTEGNN